MIALDKKTRRIVTASYALPDLETAVRQGGMNTRILRGVEYSHIDWMNSDLQFNRCACTDDQVSGGHHYCVLYGYR